MHPKDASSSDSESGSEPDYWWSPARAIEEFVSEMDEYDFEDAEEMGFICEDSLTEAVQSLDGLSVHGLRLFQTCAKFAWPGPMRALIDKGFEMPPGGLDIELYIIEFRGESKRHETVEILVGLGDRAILEWDSGDIAVPILCYFAAKGDEACLDSVLRARPDLLNSRDPASGKTLLDCAAFYLQGGVVRMLVDKGAKIADKDQEDMNALQNFMKGIEWWCDEDEDPEVMARKHGREILLLLREGGTIYFSDIGDETLRCAMVHALRKLDRLEAENRALKRRCVYGLL